MKIHSVTLKNFRGYRDDTTINFEDLTAFVGRNDIGKSTILEALDIFFNDGKGIVKLDKDDINVDARKQDDTEIKIAVCFDDLPDRVVIDSSSETTLAQEYRKAVWRSSSATPMPAVRKFLFMHCIPPIRSARI